MPCSEARLAANRANGARSKGPLSPETKAISARNSLKHGLTGRGLVTPEGDAEDISRRVEGLTADMKPRSWAGTILILQMATLSVRAERATEHESAAIALRVRHAADAFDEERIERANALFEGLADDPRNNLRKLKKMPEGIDRLIEGWRDLRADLSIEPGPEWTEAQLERAAVMTGLKSKHARGSRLGALSRGFWGDFAALEELDGDLDETSRREWVRSMLFERIDAEIAALQAHRATLDFETIELDRIEAGARALFDPSKEAGLFRRYEADACRGFFKALKEFRKVEAEVEVKSEVAPSRPASSRPEAEVGSFREMTPVPDRGPVRDPIDPVPVEKPAVMTAEERLLHRARRPKLPR